MSYLTNKEQEELLNTQSNAGETPKQNSSLMEYKPIAGTPFTAARHENKWYLLMGIYRLSESYHTEEQVLSLLKNDMWTLILKMIVAVIEKSKLHDKIEDLSNIPKKPQSEEMGTWKQKLPEVN